MKTTTEKRKNKRRRQDDVEFDPGAGAFFLPQACKYVGGIAPITMRRLVSAGKIVPNRQLRVLLFPRAELDRFLAK